MWKYNGPDSRYTGCGDPRINFIESSKLPTSTKVHIGAMGKVFAILFLAVAAFAVDAYAFGGQYFELSIQQGRYSASVVQQRLNKIGIL